MSWWFYSAQNNLSILHTKQRWFEFNLNSSCSCIKNSSLIYFENREKRNIYFLITSSLMKLSKWSLWPIGPHTWTLITLWYYFRFIYLSIYFLMYVQVASQRFVLLGAAEQPISGMTDVADILKKGNYQIFFSFNCCFYVCLFLSSFSFLHAQKFVTFF